MAVKIYKNGEWKNVASKPAPEVVKVIATSDRTSVIAGKNVPDFNPAQITQIYNAVVNKKVVVIESVGGAYYFVKEVNSNNDYPTFYLLFENSHILKYWLVGNIVNISAVALGDGRVLSVNGYDGNVVLKASDIKALNNQSIQHNLERIDENVEDVQEQIDNLKARGRFLSGWDAETGLPSTEPTTDLPYVYKAGDYYVVDNVGELINYVPTGASYTGSPSRELAEMELNNNDTFMYDGALWVYLSNTQKTITIQNVVGLESALDHKQEITLIESASDTTIGGLAVPSLTAEQIEEIFSALHDGMTAVVKSSDGDKVFVPYLADDLSGNTAVHFIYYDLVITYWVESGEVHSEYFEFATKTDLNAKADRNGDYRADGLRAKYASNILTDRGQTIDASLTTSSGQNFADRPNNAKGTATFYPYGSADRISIKSETQTIEKVYGHSYAKNNYIRDSKFTSASFWTNSWYPTSVSISNNILTATANSSQYRGTAGIGMPENLVNHTIPAGHKVFFSFSIRTDFGNLQTKPTLTFFGQYSSSSNRQTFVNSKTINGNDWTNISGVVELTYGINLRVNSNFCVYVSAVGLEEEEFLTFQLKDFYFGDLTILDQELANRADLTADMVLKAYPDIPNWEYTANPQMIDAEDFVYSSSGINLWDEKYVIAIKEGSNRLYSENFISVIPNKTLKINKSSVGAIELYDTNKNLIKLIYTAPEFIDGVFTIPSNCCFIKFYMPSSYGTTYNHDIQICLHYTDTALENTYHPYVAPATKEIHYYGGKGKSVGSVRDEVDYEVSKKRIKKVGSYTFTGSETCNKIAGTYPLYQITLTGAKNTTTNLKFSKGKWKAGAASVGNDGNYVVEIQNQLIYFQPKSTEITTVNELLAEITGLTINFELLNALEEDIPTAEQNNILSCNDYGIVSKSAGVIAGMKVLYQVNVVDTVFNNKEDIETLKNLVGSNTTELSSKLNALGFYQLPTPPADASTKTYTLKLVNGVLTYVEEQQ